MTTFLSYGVGCIAWGALLALIVCALLLLISFKNSRNGSLSPFALIAGAALFLMLSYEFSGMVFAARCKAAILDTIDTIALTVNLADVNNDKALLSRLAEEYPVINHLLDTSLLRDINLEEPLESLRTIIAGRFDDFILSRVWWSVGAAVVLGTCMFLPAGSRRKGRRRKTAKTASSTGRHYAEDFFD